ncbi:hypothetical protein OGATHE_001146 [Ogataea polymorpha]|uniref:Uncharacterized protein n=1 Tax=Ogataea polymorpha TaxID=460523 RepID=A0A9P8PRA2_9ASCO|nr:hypothetical protein OGATHE_001146 [Ogataea polymorpha]
MSLCAFSPTCFSKVKAIRSKSTIAILKVDMSPGLLVQNISSRSKTRFLKNIISSRAFCTSSFLWLPDFVSKAVRASRRCLNILDSVESIAIICSSDMLSTSDSDSSDELLESPELSSPLATPRACASSLVVFWSTSSNSIGSSESLITTSTDSSSESDPDCSISSESCSPASPSLLNSFSCPSLFSLVSKTSKSRCSSGSSILSIRFSHTVAATFFISDDFWVKYESTRSTNVSISNCSVLESV